MSLLDSKKAASHLPAGTATLPLSTKSSAVSFLTLVQIIQGVCEREERRGEKWKNHLKEGLVLRMCDRTPAITDAYNGE